MQYQIIKEGPDFQVIYKPPFVLSEDVSPLICHRLDYETSGLLLVAKSEAAREFLRDQFKKRKVKKRYLAVVLGQFPEEKIKVEGLLRRERKKPFRFESLMWVRKQENNQFDHRSFRILGKKARYSLTYFKLLDVKPFKLFSQPAQKEFNYISLVAAFPYTGRRHQIRVHLSYLGYPILGDKIYASKLSKRASEKLQISHLHLFSVYLSFLTPQGHRVEVELGLEQLKLGCKVRQAFLS